MMFCALAALVSRPAHAAPPVPLSPAVKKDVQCFILFAAAAGTATDEIVKQGAAAGTMYYLGRLNVAAPGLDLNQAVQQEAVIFETEQKAEQIGAACDSELQKRGADMMSLGAKLTQSGP